MLFDTFDLRTRYCTFNVSSKDVNENSHRKNTKSKVNQVILYDVTLHIKLYLPAVFKKKIYKINVNSSWIFLF